MMKFLKGLFLVLCFLIIYSLLLNLGHRELNPPDLKSFNEHNDQNEARNILVKLKNKLSTVKSLSAEDIKISIRRFSTNGRLFYEGDNLRLIISSFLGKEMDIGSNDEIFWFWSRRMRPQALYYSSHENSYNTNLRPIFNKEWVLECFIFSRVEETEGVSFFEKEKTLIVKSLKKSSGADHVYVVTVIDPKLLFITSKHICDANDNVMASIEYKNFQKDLIPRLIEVSWYEEGIFMRWDINSVVLNESIDECVWKVPDHEPMVDMSKN